MAARKIARLNFKGKILHIVNQALLPLPGCEGETMTVVGKVFWAGKARGGRTSFVLPIL